MTHFGTFSRLRCLPAISWSLARWVSNVWPPFPSDSLAAPVLAPFQGYSVYNFWFFFPVFGCSSFCVCLYINIFFPTFLFFAARACANDIHSQCCNIDEIFFHNFYSKGTFLRRLFFSMTAREFFNSNLHLTSCV